jgi:hypothetical protein
MASHRAPYLLRSQGINASGLSTRPTPTRTPTRRRRAIFARRTTVAVWADDERAMKIIDVHPVPPVRNRPQA